MEMELVPKPKAKSPKIITFFVVFSLIIFILTAGVYLYLKSNLNDKNKELENLKDTLVRKETSKELEGLQTELSFYKEKIDTISFLFNSYRLGTNFFKFIEKYTHPQVQWFNVNINLLTNEIVLSGQTDNYTTLIQQLYIFEGLTDVKNLKLSSFSPSSPSPLIENKSISFNLSFSLSPNLFILTK